MILIGSNFAGQSQTSDTICPPVAQLKKVYAAALQKRVCDSMNVILEARIDGLNRAIGLLNEKDSVTVVGYKNQIDLLHQEQAIYKDQLNAYEKLLRRERRKRKLVTAAGIITTGLAIYLGTLK